MKHPCDFQKLLMKGEYTEIESNKKLNDLKQYENPECYSHYSVKKINTQL